MISLRLLGAVLSCSLLLAIQAPPAGDSQPPMIKVTTRLVELNVLVHDHHGKPVDGLSKADFVVTDQGKPQEIAVFSVDRVAPTTGSGSQAPAIMPRNQFANRFTQRADMPTSATVVLLDFVNTKWADQVYAKQQVAKFLSQIHPEDRVALYQITRDGFRVIHDFTNNSQALLAAIANVTPTADLRLQSSAPDPSNTGSDTLDQFLDMANQSFAAFEIRNRVIDTCVSLKILADHFASLPGRKNLVWVSAGFPMFIGFFNDPDNQFNASRTAPNVEREILTEYVEEASRSLNTASVAVYPVDARGLFGLPMADASKTPKMVNGRLPASMTRINHSNTDTMQYMADLTGGKAYFDTNDIRGSIRKAIDDSAVTYTLGYYTPEENWDNRFHRIKVKVTQSGLEVRAKKGYTASAQKALSLQQVDQIIREAMWSPLDSGGIGITATITPSPEKPSASRVVLSILGQDVRFSNEDGRYRATLDVVFSLAGKDGKPAARDKQTLDIALKPETYTRIMQQGLPVGRDIPVTPANQSIKAVVVDRATGTVGTVTIPVTQADRSPSGA